MKYPSSSNNINFNLTLILVQTHFFLFKQVYIHHMKLK